MNTREYLQTIAETCERALRDDEYRRAQYIDEIEHIARAGARACCQQDPAPAPAPAQSAQKGAVYVTLTFRVPELPAGVTADEVREYVASFVENRDPMLAEATLDAIADLDAVACATGAAANLTPEDLALVGGD